MLKVEIKSASKSISKEDFLMLQEIRTIAPKLHKYKGNANVGAAIAQLQARIKAVRAVQKAKGFNIDAKLETNLCEPDMSKAADKYGRYPWKFKKLSYTQFVSERREVYPTVIMIKKHLQAKLKAERIARKVTPRETRYAQNVNSLKLGRCHLEGGTFMKIYKRKLRQTIFESKKPKTLDNNYVGVEIEFASTKDREFIADQLFDAGLASYISLRGDGSIATDATYRYSHEICVIATQKEIYEVITKLCKLLNDTCGVRVDKSCGLHVHLDMRNRAKEIAFSNLVSMQNILYRMVPASRKTGQYSRPTQGKTWRILDDRYHGINSAAYRKHNTLEVRIHSGTVDSNKINPWIELLIASVEVPEIKRAPTTAKGAQKMLGLSDELTAYIDTRMKRFERQHNKADGTDLSVLADEDAA